MDESREGSGPSGEREQVVEGKFQGQAARRVPRIQAVEKARGLKMKVLRAAPQAMQFSGELAGSHRNLSLRRPLAGGAQ